MLADAMALLAEPDDVVKVHAHGGAAIAIEIGPIGRRLTLDVPISLAMQLHCQLDSELRREAADLYAEAQHAERSAFLDGRL